MSSPFNLFFLFFLGSGEERKDASYFIEDTHQQEMKRDGQKLGFYYRIFQIFFILILKSGKEICLLPYAITQPIQSYLGYGMLMKDMDHYEFFRHFISDNRPIIQTCKELKLHNIEPPHHDENAAHNIFLPNSGLFVQALILALLVIGFICLLGLLYEVVRWKLNEHTKL